MKSRVPQNRAVTNLSNRDLTDNINSVMGKDVFVQKQCEPASLADTCNRLNSDGFQVVSTVLAERGTQVIVLAKRG